MIQLALVVPFVVTAATLAQPLKVIDQPPLRSLEGQHTPGPRPSRGTLALVDPASLAREFKAAPLERLGDDLTTYGLPIDLPHPEGGTVTCFVARSPVMEDGLAAKFPDFHTLIVQTADRAAGGRLELTPRGLTGMLRASRPTGAGDSWMIDLWQSADPTLSIAYWLRDLPNSVDWTCGTAPDVVVPADSQPYAPRVFTTTRTYRLAVACTGEYAVHHSTLQNNAPNVADPLAAIVTVVSRANVVYENDLGVHFNLVANNDLLIFVDPLTDPYDATCSGGGGADCSANLLAPNGNTLDSVIGSANYDVGHLLTRIYGGVAMLRSVCTGSKGRAISGIPRGGDIDPLSALVPIHELGHQFGANHTFSGVRGRCEGNVSLATAYEAGSGSSPMAYAGGCPVGDAPPSDNVATFADPWFHSASLIEMNSFLGSGGGSVCAVVADSSNNHPVISAGTTTAIPPGTPFALTVQATDQDNDPLTYSWEQYDSGVARALVGGTDNGAGALFRVFPPVTSPTRTFPQWSDILSGVSTPGEMLPTTVDVTRRFRVVVRDNRLGAGGVATSSNRQVQIRGSGPFAITGPTEGAMRRPGSTSLTWTTGGSEAFTNPVTTVAAQLSLDDGQTFPIALGNLANDGSATVSLPAVTQTATARLKLSPTNGIFFAVSRPFLLRPPCSSDFNQDGDFGTDSDIEAFFACLAGSCCPTCDPHGQDFNADGDYGTDQDIEAFFRVLAGGSC